MFEIVGKLETENNTCTVLVKRHHVRMKVVGNGKENFIITQKENPKKNPRKPPARKSAVKRAPQPRSVEPPPLVPIIAPKVPRMPSVSKKESGKPSVDEKGFWCFACDILHSSRSLLLTHLSVEHNVTLYKCDFCEEKFADSTFRERHITKVHVRFPSEAQEEETEELDEEFFDNMDADPDDEDWTPEQEEVVVKKQPVAPAMPKKAIEQGRVVKGRLAHKLGFGGKPKMFGSKKGRPSRAAMMEWKKRRSEVLGIDARLNQSSDEEDYDFDPWWALPKETPDPKKALKDTQKMCHICGEMRVTLATHLRKVHANYTHCSQCNGKIKEGIDTPHRCPRRKPSYRCSCGQEYTIKEHMHGHLLDKDSPKHQIQCPSCEECFNDFQPYHEHQDMMHPLPFICSVCGKPFSKKSNLKSHMYSIHVKEKPPMKCEICGAECLGERNMKRHIMHVHRKATRINCEICKISIFDKVSLRRHMTYKHGLKKNYVCNVCKREFATADALRYHITTHTGERAFPCPFCPKAFKINSELRKHYRAHKDLTIKCPSCSLYCLNEEDLRAHLRRFPAHDVKFPDE